ncbi:hypothetical protein HZC27_05940 [Candidatus Roizmanbacteria bacterium]|nr:hypothetical protein [Candidatus Roizmanbacteria bacterium]
MYILGLSAYYHDSAAILLNDGKILCGIEEERFTRIKHDNAFPYKAIEFCLKEAKLTINDIGIVSYYEKPLLKFERILETFIATYPWSLKPFLKGMPEWIDYKIKVEHTIRTKLKYKGRISFTPHHVSHAAAFYTSPFKESAILTIDGVGEYQTTGLWLGKDNKIMPLKKIDFPHSLGLLYSTFTAFLGFKVNEDEYKLMGLAAYGKSKYNDLINQLIDTRDDGSFRLNLKYFSFRESFQMWSQEFEKLVGPPRKTKEPITQRHKDLAASIQTATEEIYFKILKYLHTLTKNENVCISGGVALNALANGKIYSKTPFKNVHIFGAAGDSGAALGSALNTHYTLVERGAVIPAKAGIQSKITSLSVGSSYSNSEIEPFLKKYKLKYEKLSEKNLIAKSSQLIAKGYILAWFQGPCELGPRALGNRSILCKPNPRNMKEKMNVIKRREMFRPFAGSILQEKVHEYFEVPEKNHPSPFMVFCFPVRKEKRKELAAIVHADGTCRIQTVSKENDRYYQLIKNFYKLTGIPCILNTSFNLMGEPIVETPKQAIEDFLKTRIDCLIIGDFLVKK